MKTWFRRMSLRRRIWVSFIGLLCFAVAATGFFAYRIAVDIVQAKVLEQSTDSLNKTAQAMDESLKRMMITVLSMLLSEPMKMMVKDVSIGDDSRYVQHLSALQSSFAQARMNEAMIHSMLVVTPIGEFYPLTNARNTQVKFEDTELYAQIVRAKRPVWVEAHEDRLFTDRERVLSLVLTEVSETPIEDTYIVLNISEDALRKSVLANINSPGKQFYLIGRDGRPVLRLGGENWEPQLRQPAFQDGIAEEQSYGSFDYTVDRQPYIVEYARMSVQKDWRLVQVQPKAEMFRELQRIQWITIIVAAGSILVALFVSNVLTRIVFGPLIKLQHVMKRVGNNDLSVRFHSDYQDEVSQLGDRFNHMLEQIATLIGEIRHTETEKRKSDVKALQAQIDPHFLYNTLNTIYMNAELNETDNVKSMILGLSRLFQLGLNGGRDMTTVEKEMTHVTEYLKLQQQSYEGLFAFEIEVDPGLLNEPIMKLICQPLAENVILHGFRDRQEGGRIRIELQQDDRDHLVLRVSDNGSGFNVAALRYELLNQGDPQRGYALRNVYHRLLLYYGERVELLLESEANVRTVVGFRFPREGVEFA